MSENLYKSFCHLTNRSDRPAIRCEDKRTLSYSDLDDLTARISGILQKTGIKTGDRVAVKVEKTPEALALYLACLRVGAVYLPMNTAYKQDETAYILEDASPKIFIHDPNEHNHDRCVNYTLNGAGEGSLFDVSSEPCTSLYEADSDRIAAILYTSGTTGKPKGAMLSHKNLASNAQALAKAWRFHSKDVILHALPIFHAHGLFVAANIALLMGNEMIFLPHFDAKKVISHLASATVYMGVPTHYTRLLNEKSFTKEACTKIRVFISGSAPLLPTTFEAFEQRTGQKILERYGMTETVMNCSNPYDGPRVAGSVGTALPGVKARIVDESGARVAANIVGSLEVKGPNVFQGYWGKDEITAASFTKDGFFKTGDMAEMDENGCIRLAGRSNDMIISGGFNVYPIEVEELLNSQANVIEAAVIGIDHPDFGEAVVAICESQGIDEVSLRRALKTRLANYKIPKRIIAINALPRNTMGKVEKAKLRSEYKDLFRH